MNKKLMGDLRSKFSSVPSSDFDCQFGSIKINDGRVHIDEKGLTSSRVVAKEAAENRAFERALVAAQSKLIRRKGSAQFIAEIDSGLMGIVSNRGKMGGGLIMSMRDSGAPTMPNTLGFSAGKIVSDEERKAGAPINYVSSNAFSEIEFTYVENSKGISFLPNMLTNVSLEESRGFEKVLDRGINLFSNKILGDKEPAVLYLGVAYRGEFTAAPYILEGNKVIKGAAFAIEHDNGSSDIIIPLLLPNFVGEGEYALCDIEVRGGELAAGKEENLKSLNRQIVYTYGRDAKVIVFQTGKVLYETNSFSEFIERSGMRQAVMAGKTTGISSQVKTVLFGNYGSVKVETGWGTVEEEMAPKSAMVSALSDLWKEAKREDLQEV